LRGVQELDPSKTGRGGQVQVGDTSNGEIRDLMLEEAPVEEISLKPVGGGRKGKTRKFRTIPPKKAITGTSDNSTDSIQKPKKREVRSNRDIEGRESNLSRSKPRTTSR